MIVVCFSYVLNDEGKVGVYIAAQPLIPEHSYFEMEIIDTGILGAIGKKSAHTVYMVCDSL